MAVLTVRRGLLSLNTCTRTSPALSSCATDIARHAASAEPVPIPVVTQWAMNARSRCRIALAEQPLRLAMRNRVTPHHECPALAFSFRRAPTREGGFNLIGCGSVPAQARDSLTKARVTIHSFQTELVEQDIQAGLKIAAKVQAEGEVALIERNRRRMGLGLSLGAILLVILGLGLYIRQIETEPK